MLAEDRRTICTDVLDLVTPGFKTRGVRDWTHAEVSSPTLFIVEGYEGPAGREQVKIQVAANFFDAMRAREIYGKDAADIYLFAHKQGSRSREIVFGRIEEVVGISAAHDVLITLEDGDSFLMEGTGQRHRLNKIASASVLYKSKLIPTIKL